MIIVNVIELSECMVYKVHSFTDIDDQMFDGQQGAEDKFVELIQKHLETQAVPHEILMDYIRKRCYTTVNGYRIEIIDSEIENVQI